MRYFNELLDKKVEQAQISETQVSMLFEGGLVLIISMSPGEDHIHVFSTEMPITPMSHLDPMYMPCRKLFNGPLKAFTPMLPPNPGRLAENLN